MKDNRKKWTQPQLIVLGRGTPEENVLAGCKMKKLAGPFTTNTSCNKTKKKPCQTKCSVISKTS